MNGSPTHDRLQNPPTAWPGSRCTTRLSRSGSPLPTSACRNPLLIKITTSPLTNSGIHALKTFHSNVREKGLLLRSPYFKPLGRPTWPCPHGRLGRALRRGVAEKKSADTFRYLGRLRWRFHFQRGGRVKQTFGANALHLKRTAERLGLHTGPAAQHVCPVNLTEMGSTRETLLSPRRKK
jgi:hypothetical protein